MIRMIQSKSASHAKSYFSDALSKSDYYVSDQELSGFWEGKLAARLGVVGDTSKEAFFALCENRHPIANTSLTPRTKDARRVGYDINFHCPKSVSILHALSNDTHILDAFKASVSETMQSIENDSKGRVRKGKANENRTTGELIWGHFVHQTARPVEGYYPDPHLHSHCFVFNATWDAVEGRVKAGEFGDIKRDMPYYQAQFHMRLADKLTALGYNIQKTAKAFEIDGVPKQVIELFSKRTDEIGRVAKEHGITDASELAELGARTRAGKDKGASMDELKLAWHAQIKRAGIPPAEAGKPLRGALKSLPESTVQECVDYAVAHCFVRASVVEDRRILQEAYRYALGKGLKAVDIDNAFANDKRIIRVMEYGRSLCTTKDVLAEERRMVEIAKRGVGAIKPLYANAPAISLFGQQAAAIEHVLTTYNRISIIRGAAGSGKTTLMKEAIPLIEATGKRVVTVAPSATASRGVLRSEGFSQANTVASLLESKEMQASLKNQVLWVDEAGMLGTKEMTAILELAEKYNTQVIFGGDTRQHAAVSRGDALRILNTIGGIKTAEVDKIYRQQDLKYREAVQDLAKGNIGAGFAKLDDAGFIHEVDAGEVTDRLAKAYLTYVKQGIETLVICPTHIQGDAATRQIRDGLRKERMIGKKEIEVERLKNLNWTEAERTDIRLYQQGQVVQFTQNLKGIKRGSRWTVQKDAEGIVTLHNSDGNTKPLLPAYTEHLVVFDKVNLTLSKGDIVRITHNGFDTAGKRLDNGDVFTIASISKKGGIVLRNEKSKVAYSIGNDFGHIAHAYCVTSQFSQSKTVDMTLVYQPVATFAATNDKQFYVTVSRSRKGLMVLSDDKEELLSYALRSGDRQSAIELMRSRKLQKEFSFNAERLQQTVKTMRDFGLDY